VPLVINLADVTAAAPGGLQDVDVSLHSRKQLPSVARDAREEIDPFLNWTMTPVRTAPWMICFST